jgi:FMN phosphatase YigB (HAD superfamily)
MVLEEWGLSPDQVIVVGDTLNTDIAGAHSAGMRGVWIDRGRVNPWSKNDEHRDHIVPDATIQQLADLPALLAGGFTPG